MPYKQKNITKESALARAQYLCAQQEKCEYDIRTSLLKWGTRDPEINTIIQSLIKEKFIDDLRYAIAFVKDKSAINKWGKHKIEFALKQKKINEKNIQLALKEINEIQQERSLEKELIKKLKSLKDQDEYILRSKLIRFGLSKGFENGKVFDMVKKVLDTHSLKN